MTDLSTAIEGMKHWDWCPICRGGLDTGLECESCGADLMPIQKALTEKTMKPTDPAVLALIRARAVRCRLGYGGRAWVTSDPKSEVVEDRMWLLEYIDQEARATNRLREQLQIAADSFRNLGCAVDADDCEEAINESLSGGNPGEPKACTPAEERGIVGATGAGQPPDGDPESTGDSADRRSPAGHRESPAPDGSTRHPHEPGELRISKHLAERTSAFLKQWRENGPDCDCDEYGHRCGWPRLVSLADEWRSVTKDGGHSQETGDRT